MENIPEKFKNQDGTLNADALIKSYVALEKKIGTMISVPSDDADDDMRNRFRRAIGVPDAPDNYPKNDLFDDENLRAKFFEIGLTSSQVSQIYNIAQEFLSPVISDLFATQSQAAAISELKNFFGGDEKMNDAIKQINAFGEQFLPRDAFDALCTTPQGIQGIYRMMQSVEPNVEIANDNNKNLSDSDLRRMMRDPKYWRDHDSEYVRKIENGFKKLYS